MTPQVTRPSAPLDPDKLASIPRHRALEAAITAMGQLQDWTPEEIAAGLSLCFAAMCAQTGMDPHARYRMALRMLEPQLHHPKENDAMQSFRDFFTLRVAGRETTIA